MISTGKRGRIIDETKRTGHAVVKSISPASGPTMKMTNSGGSDRDLWSD